MSENVAAVARDILRVVPSMYLKLRAMCQALRGNKAYREEFRRGLVAFRDKQLERQRMIIPRL
jgi:hypothetical protein